jgi:hypothetical protein
MLRGTQLIGFGAIAIAALIALAGCGHNFYSGEREAWRREAEVACLTSGAIRESPSRVRISPISGPGICGADYPIQVSAIGESGPLGYTDEPVRPSAELSGSVPQHWPVARSPPLPADAAPGADYGSPAVASQGRPSPSAPAPLRPMRSAAKEATPAATATPVWLRAGRPIDVTAAIGPVEVKPTATLACPLVPALDQWITAAVQPAALRWFHQPVIEIEQISAYSCRGMNDNPNARISEHSFGNALDISTFVLADGHKVTVQYGWHGPPDEQGFLHDVQLAACNEFSTVLAPGANIYHYNHIHVDLMRRYSGQRICDPAAIPARP